MKKFLLGTITLVTMFAVNLQANAGILIEPYAGTHFNSKAGKDEDDLKGTAFGGRLGFQNLGLMLGLNYKTGTANIDSDNGDADYKFSHQGFFVGYELPIMFRFWAEYVLSGNSKHEEGTTTIEYKKISGTQFGVGYTGLPFISINLEYGSTDWADGEFKTNVASGDLNDDATVKTYFLSVSLPFTI